MRKSILWEMLFRNKLMNDFDGYIYELCLFGLGLIEERPTPDDFGLNDIHPVHLSIFMSNMRADITEIK